MKRKRPIIPKKRGPLCYVCKRAEGETFSRVEYDRDYYEQIVEGTVTLREFFGFHLCRDCETATEGRKLSKREFYAADVARHREWRRAHPLRTLGITVSVTLVET